MVLGDGSPQLLEPAQVEVQLTRPEVAATRHRHACLAEPRHQRAHDLDRGAHALHQLVRRHLDSTLDVSIDSVPSATKATRAPRYSSTSRMVCTSSMSGTLCSTLVPEASNEAAISLSAESWRPTP